MYDIQSRPRKNGGLHSHSHSDSHSHSPSPSATAVLPKRVRLVPSTISDSSCKSYSSTPTAGAYALSPYSLASPALDPTSFTAKDRVSAATAPPEESAAVTAAAFGGFEPKDDDTMQSLLDNFSTLESEIKSLLKGKNSLKDRIQSLGSKQESMRSVIQNMEDKQLESIKSKLDVMEQQARGRVDYLNSLKQERIHSLEQARNSEYLEQPVFDHSAATATSFDEKRRAQSCHQQDHSQENQSRNNTIEPALKRIISCWDENNCDLHLKRLIHSSRQIAAFEILEFAHKRLSTHLINHISETARALVGDEKTGYLGQFLKHGPFESKPVGEGTYGELLKFVQREAKPRRELLKALKAAEDSLVQEAVASGYRAIEVGDIRSQMTGFFTTSMQNLSRYYYPIPLADAEVTRDVIDDTRLAAEQGKLGALQKASKLIKLGCYFLQWQLAAQAS
ncbi:hypothetical protein SELMODRAFT_422293 [Selaginella moellendorffii]|uniref:Uncharacterized protein n=1 Tax=Selaginella moellendorffii TaxID=88036 RepID=D8SIJ8_SELML|nr:hypothetical protein SELMODRAFT_422293 [Selaginella moellendorffii]